MHNQNLLDKINLALWAILATVFILCSFTSCTTVKKSSAKTTHDSTATARVVRDSILKHATDSTYKHDTKVTSNEKTDSSYDKVTEEIAWIVPGKDSLSRTLVEFSNEKDPSFLQYFKGPVIAYKKTTKERGNKVVEKHHFENNQDSVHISKVDTASGHSDSGTSNIVHRTSDIKTKTTHKVFPGWVLLVIILVAGGTAWNYMRKQTV